MDFATVIGFVFSVGAIAWAMYEGTHGKLGAFYSTEGFVLVLGGSIAAVMLSMPMTACRHAFGYLKKWLFAKEENLPELIKKLVSFSEIARRDGVLALEEVARQQTDPFLSRALQLAVDGTEAHVIEQTLKCEIGAMAERHKHGKKFFELLGKFGPGFGLTATLIGQVCMFQNMGGDSAAIGRALAVALLGTLYGCIICNVISGPIADKLGLRSAEEQFVKELILTGVLSVQAGDNPRIVQFKLTSFVSARDRKSIITE